MSVDLIAIEADGTQLGKGTLTAAVKVEVRAFQVRSGKLASLPIVTDKDGNKLFFSPYEEKLPATGVLTIELPPTDSPDVDPQNFVYRLRIKNSGVVVTETIFELPAATVGPIPVADLVSLAYLPGDSLFVPLYTVASAAAEAAAESESNAADSATTASSAAGVATDAETGALAAQGASEDAESGAEDARDLAEGYRDQAQAATTGKVSKAGDIMTGLLTLSGDPTGPLHAATRQYVLAQITALVNGAPGALDTLNELAAALQSDETAAGALTTLVGNLRNLSDSAFSTALSATYGARTAPPRAPTTLPPATPGETITTFQTSHGWTATGGATGTDLNDTTAGGLGTQCATLVSTNAGVVTLDSPTLTTPVDLTKRSFRMLVKVDQTTPLADLQLYAANEAGFTNYRRFILLAPEAGGDDFAYLKAGEWTWLTVAWTNGVMAGSPSRSSLVKFRFRVVSTSGQTVTVHLAALATQKQDRTPVFPNGVVSFTYDDGRASGYTAGRTALEAQGWTGTLFPIRDRIGLATYVTTQQLLDAQRAGWEIGTHADVGANHDAGFTTMTAAQVEDDLFAERTWFYANGFGNVSGFAWPRGMSTQLIEDAAGKTVAYGRGIYTAGFSQRETLPPANRMRLRAIGVGNTQTLAFLTGEVDKAIAAGEWVIFVFHNVVASGATTSLDALQATHDGLVSYIAGLATKPAVLPVSDVVRRAGSPELTDVATGGDLTGTLANASVAKVKGVAVSGTSAAGKVLTGVDAASASWQPASGAVGLFVNNRIAGGEPTIPRMIVNGSSAATSGRLLLTYFTPEVTETITAVALGSAVAAGATPTLVRAGIYSIDGSGNGTLVASTPNDTTIFAAASRYQKNLSASWSKVAGQRYALGILIVTGASLPTYPVANFSALPSLMRSAAPRLEGTIDSQTDLPSSFLSSDPVSRGVQVYTELLR